MRLLTSLVAVVVLVACGGTVAGGNPGPVANSSRTVSPEPSAAPILPVEIASPTALGASVASRVLPPATVLPAVPLCTTPVQVYKDGNAGPLLCKGGALNVNAWQWFEQNLQAPVMAAGPGLSAGAQRTALCRVGPQNMTVPEAQSAYWLAAVYYGWTPIDAGRVLIAEGCR